MTGEAAGESPCVVVFARSGVEVTAQPGENLLEVAERAGIDVPSLCRGGTCGTCITRVLAGQVQVESIHGLTRRQVALGYVLTCSSRTRAGRLVLDA